MVQHSIDLADILGLKDNFKILLVKHGGPNYAIDFEMKDLILDTSGMSGHWRATDCDHNDVK